MSRTSVGLAGDVSAPAAIADFVITYTTDDPGTTANSAITFADGDAAMSAAEEYEWADELEAKINLILAALRDAGIIQT